MVIVKQNEIYNLHAIAMEDLFLISKNLHYRTYSCISRVSGTQFEGKISGVDLYTSNVFGHVAAESS